MPPLNMTDLERELLFVAVAIQYDVTPSMPVEREPGVATMFYHRDGTDYRLRLDLAPEGSDPE